MTLQTDWEDLKLKIKTKWAKLTDEEIEIFKDNLDLITTKIQQLYGSTKEEVEKEYKDFKAYFKIIPKPPRLSEENKTKSI